MRTGKRLLNDLVDELNTLKLPFMAAKLEALYNSPDFLNMDRMTILAELINGEYEENRSKQLRNRLKRAKLLGSPEELYECKDTTERNYLPSGIIETLSDLEFINNVSIPLKQCTFFGNSVHPFRKDSACLSGGECRYNLLLFR